MKKLFFVLLITFVCFQSGCAALDALASQIGAPQEGESATVAYRVIRGAANLAPNWATNAVLALTTLLGWYKNSRNKKKVKITAEGVEKGIRKLNALKESIVQVLASDDNDRFKTAATMLMDGEDFRDIIASSAKAYTIYEELRRDVKKALKGV